MELVVDGRAVIPAAVGSAILELLTQQSLPPSVSKPVEPEALFVAVSRALHSQGLDAGAAQPLKLLVLPPFWNDSSKFVSVACFQLLCHKIVLISR